MTNVEQGYTKITCHTHSISLFEIFLIFDCGSECYVFTPSLIDNTHLFMCLQNITGSGRCWSHLVGIYLLTLIFIYFLEKEFVIYAKYRHQYLRQVYTVQTPAIMLLTADCFLNKLFMSYSLTSL